LRVGTRKTGRMSSRLVTWISWTSCCARAFLAATGACSMTWRTWLPARRGRRGSVAAQPGNGASFAEWSTFRIRDVERWTQYGDAYQQVLAGCLRLNQVAWLNVVPFRTPPNRAPSLRQRNHGLEHLIPMLNLLNPAAVVTRYPTPHAVADALSDGRWEVLPLDDRRASHASILAARDRLRALALCTAR